MLQRLQAGASYQYRVEQSGSLFQSHFRTAPPDQQAIRFIAYSDCETEPESTGARVSWDDPSSDNKRSYLVDQTEGYAANLKVIRESNPDFVLIAGDLVETGGEQRDWDEFWKHNTCSDGEQSLASQIPIVAIPGNHEYYAGPRQGQYGGRESERAMDKFATYFRVGQNQRYTRLNYGPITILGLDVCNGQPDGSSQDTNLYLASNDSQAPDFNPGSLQYLWLEHQLAQARQRSQFVIVTFHHSPYASGVHGLPPGSEAGLDKQSGQPTRILFPLLMKYRVDAVITGHDEMWERSEVSGLDEEGKPHSIQLWDVGIGGDGLRGPNAKAKNPFLQFLAHRDSPERWQGPRLVDGGKHYGHLEVEIVPEGRGWKATFIPVYVFPVSDDQGKVVRFERRTYPDVVELRK